MTDTTNAPWRSAGYSDIRAAQRMGADIEIEFANGDVVRISPVRFGIEGDFEVRFDVDESPAVQLVTPEGLKEVSWMQLRTATDPEFAQEMRRQDAEESRRIGRRLRALREDRGLSQREVAGLVGMTAPQLSKIENGTYDLRLSTVQTLLRAMNASFADISGPDALEFSLKALRRSAEKAGVAGELVDRLISRSPRHLIRRIFQRALGWDLSSGELSRPSATEVGLQVLFKTIQADADPGASPMLTLAFACSETIGAAVQIPAFEGIPAAREVRRAAVDRHGIVTLPSLLEWVWSHGIVTIPLQGKGAFCAAALSVHDRPVVVLKDSRALAAFWLFDLAHELGHIANGHTHHAGVVDVDQLRPDESNLDLQENQANAYALELLLGDPAALVQAVRIESRGNYLRFKTAVATVANQAQVGTGLLGMVTAYELTDIGQPKDRWGSATNLAAPEGDGREQVEAALRARLEVRRLAEEDEALVAAAVFGN